MTDEELTELRRRVERLESRPGWFESFAWACGITALLYLALFVWSTDGFRKPIPPREPPTQENAQ